MLTVCSATFSQELILELSLKDQVSFASNVLEGEVLSSDTFWDAEYNNIYTRHRVKVYRVFKGSSYEEIYVVTEGGVIGLQAEVVSNALELRKGDHGVFILNELTNPQIRGEFTNTFKPLSGIQSFYKYSVELNKVANVFKSYNMASQFHTKIESFTGVNSVIIEDSNLESSIINNRMHSSTPVINSFSSTNTTAGTKTILTINGSGFGTTAMPSVGFCDANYGGALFYDVTSTQILSWNDTEIQVEIPDRAGTGTVRIVNDNNQTGFSSTDLIIDFAQINLDYNNIAYQTQHIDSNNSGGFTWDMNTDFYNSSAVDAYARALEAWSCQSGINWDVSQSTTTVGASANDGINVVTFDDASPLPPSVLGRCTSRYSGCVSGGEVKWYVEEMDIVFNNAINWNFSINPPANNEIDFESVAVHELGHGQQLGHVINDSEVMHFSISANTVSRDLSENDIEGANDVHNRSSAITICSQPVMEDSNCSTLSINAVVLNDSISIFPNPVSSGMLNIKSGQNNFINKVTVFNAIGKRMFDKQLSSNNGLEQLNVSSLNDGLYLLEIQTNSGTVNKKLLVK